MRPEMCPDMAALYRKVFKTYPYPIFDPGYLKDTMEDNIAYFGVHCGGKLVAVASGEMNKAYENAEMTDFAIDPDYRGRGFAKHLLKATEEDMEKRGIKTLYTIARAPSLPMNCTFAAMGYIFGGTLVSNTQIAGTIESMNVWHKKL
jgi:putative beta-lysine N-acetyltransferase